MGDLSGPWLVGLGVLVMGGPRINPETGRGYQWKGGRTVMRSGYVRIFVSDHPLAHKDGQVLEHRMVLHEAGIEIPLGYSVHHRNHDKTDNRLENLEVMPKGHHHRHHIQQAGEVTNQYGTYPLTGLDRLAAIKRWQQANPEKMKEYRRRTRERRRGR